ncbi:hypothetical protein B0H14DRAFT_2609941 [Mycena olivaceomarginata]|nr:hypothetical protein B0H14DRAFT_2609941 [Mycena olivaceomarginata]
MAPKEKAVAYPEEVLWHTDVRLPQHCSGGAEDENVEHSVGNANALMSSVPWTRICAGMAALDDSGWAKAWTQGTWREEHAKLVKQEGDAGSGRGAQGAERRAGGEAGDADTMRDRKRERETAACDTSTHAHGLPLLQSRDTFETHVVVFIRIVQRRQLVLAGKGRLRKLWIRQYRPMKERNTVKGREGKERVRGWKNDEDRRIRENGDSTKMQSKADVPHRAFA